VHTVLHRLAGQQSLDIKTSIKTYPSTLTQRSTINTGRQFGLMLVKSAY
jgi:hypothetical protein